MSDKEIINKVAESGIITIDLKDYMPKGERVQFDIKNLLFQDLILREKDLRDFIKTTNWEDYRNKIVTLYCSNDAIVPTWAYMLLAIALEPYASRVVQCDPSQTETVLMTASISQIDVDPFKNARVVIKGCGEEPIPVSAYVQLTEKLKPIVKSIMYGEPCSTVPLYKAK